MTTIERDTLYQAIRECWNALASLPNGPERIARLREWGKLCQETDDRYGLPETTRMFREAVGR